ncbi:hypothetical protein C0V97_07675 [Asaia sp. W19]|nr:hypothetical protein C0V97_07675 [Asaia sp. W19]
MFMTLALAMNVHALASRMGQDERPVQPENSDPGMAPSKVPTGSTRARENTLEAAANVGRKDGWQAIPVVSQGPAPGDDMVPVDAAFLNNDAPASSCVATPCVPGSIGETTGPTKEQAQAELVKRLLSRQGSIEDEQHRLEEQKHVLDSARIALEDRMRAIDNSMAELAEKQAQHKELMVAETSRLVKIYEEMPPREAAAVFNIMDIHVLVSIANSMNPRKISAIMGYMFPERVNTVSQYLAGVRSFRPNRTTPDSMLGHAPSAGVLSWLPNVPADRSPSAKE